MAISVVMPALEMAQETGKLVAWLKQEGESVRKGEPLLEIETDKAVMEVEALADGTLAGVTGKAGTDIPVGQTIAWIVAPGEKAPDEAAPAAVVVTETVTVANSSSTATASEPVSPSAAAAGGQVSPKARRLAKEAGIDIATVRGSGPGGEILASDVQALVDAKAQGTAPSAPAGTLSSIGRLMAERTTQSWTTVPHFFVQRDIDASALNRELNRARAALAPEMEASQAVKLTHTDLLIALVGRTLAKHPRMNASWIEDGIRLNPEVNVAIAMAVEDGVVAPVIRNANTAPLSEIAKQRRDLTDRARANRLRPADLAGGTFTVSNLGMFQVDSFSAIITPPQAAILAVGAIADRPVAINGEVAVRPMLSVTLSSDHRVISGAMAAAFLQELVTAMQEPETWLG